eukprot:1002002-Prorocentrum_minimum.AAC.1
MPGLRPGGGILLHARLRRVAIAVARRVGLDTDIWRLSGQFYGVRVAPLRRDGCAGGGIRESVCTSSEWAWRCQVVVHSAGEAVLGWAPDWQGGC